MHRPFVSAVLACLLCASSAFAQVVITELNLPGSYTWTTGDAINSWGQVAGTATSLGPPFRAMVWTGGIGVDLGALCADCNSAATAINDAGDVAGWSTQAGDPNQYAVLWRSGTMTILPPLPGDTRAVANGINNLGLIVGTSSGSTGNHGVLWRDGIPEPVNATTVRAINDAGMMIGTQSGVGAIVIQPDGAVAPLPSVSGSCSNPNAFGLNEAGTVVGTVGLLSPQGFCSTFPAVWVGGVPQVLPPPAGAASAAGGAAVAINEHNDIVGNAFSATGPLQAVMWRNGQAIELGTLPFPQPIQSRATDINASGVISGYSRIDKVSFPATTHAVTFTVTPPNTPPTLTLPGNLIVPASSPSGVTVSFSVAANDAEDGVFRATCTPASGSLFAIGTTTVACSAVDTGGLDATGSFTVTVLGPVDQINTLIAQLPATAPGRALENTLRIARTAITANRPLVAAVTLSAFDVQVTLLAITRRLPTDQALALLAASRQIRRTIGF
jgi:uncharacterized membrane protein